jgi:hypothetical protein
MQSTTPTKAHWASARSGIWARWRGYTVRWLLFAEIVQLFQPIPADLDTYWQEKLYQALSGLLFGSVCAIVFTLTENTLNTPRVKWKSWLIVAGTWLAVKLVFVSVIAMANQAVPV